MKCNTKKYASGDLVAPPQPPITRRPPPPQTDEELDKISPEARRMMEEKMREMEQEKRQRMMEKQVPPSPMKKGGKVKAKSSASKRADGCAQRGKTKGRMI